MSDHIPQYFDLEASTRILVDAALQRGFGVTVLSADHSYIELRDSSDRRYEVIGATVHRGSNMLALWKNEQKDLSKLLLAQQGIRVPKGIVLTERMAPLELAQRIEHLAFPLVVKPATSNFGLGVRTRLTTLEDVAQAVDACARFGNRSLVEEHIDGKDCRVLILDHRFECATYRVPPNVVGDGRSSISVLLQSKNMGRGVDNRSALRKLVLDDRAHALLLAQGLSADSVVADGHRIWLGDTANMSRGADSIDATCDIPVWCRILCERISRVFDSRILGVDIILGARNGFDTSLGEYTILEVNEAPMLSMHAYPYQGMSRDVGPRVLDIITSPGRLV